MTERAYGKRAPKTPGGPTHDHCPVDHPQRWQHHPQHGFGVFQIPPDETAAAVRSALDVGYRHIDTAEMYGNEAGVAAGISESGVDRAEVFITSKLNNGYHRPDDARRAFDSTLKALHSNYVDLFLIHWPLPTLYDGDFVSTWKVLEQFARTGGHAASACRTSSPHTWTGSPKNRHNAGGQPDRGAPVLRQ